MKPDPFVFFDNRSRLPGHFISILRHLNQDDFIVVAPSIAIRRTPSKNGVFVALESLAASEDWKAFTQNYVHLSTNSIEFELSCFQRYFVILEAAKILNIVGLWILDTDVWPTVELNAIRSHDSSLVFSSTKPDSVISPHTSHFSLEKLQEFTHFLTRGFYQNHLRELTDHFQGMREQGLPGGISDMTALAYWLRVSGHSWTNSKQIQAPAKVSHNFEEDLLPEGNLEIVAPKAKGNPARTFLVIRDGLIQNYASIHFQGRTKWIQWGLAVRGNLKGGSAYWHFLVLMSEKLLSLKYLSDRVSKAVFQMVNLLRKLDSTTSVQER